MKNPKILVFNGGISPEREVSLVSGKHVCESLKKSFDAEAVRLDENKLPSGFDPAECVVFPAMHGDYGEDGTLQDELDAAGFAYAGCAGLASRVCMVKPASKSRMKTKGLPVARGIEFNAAQKPSAKLAFEMFPNGAVLKPADKGSSVGLVVARTAEELERGLGGISEGSWMLEEFYKGREFSIGVIGGAAAGIVEIIPEGGVYDFKRKYTAGSTRYEFPAKVSEPAARAMKNAAESAFKVCGCRDFARVDFLMADESAPNFIILEINTLPGMTPTSLLPKSASCVGYNFDSLCEKLVEGAFKRFFSK